MHCKASLLKAQTLVKIFHPFFHSAKSRANNYVIRSVLFALSGTSGIWYRTLILIFLNFVLFFTLNAHRKIVNNECENPGEAQKECTPPWRRQPSPPAWKVLKIAIYPRWLQNLAKSNPSPRFLSVPPCPCHIIEGIAISRRHIFRSRIAWTTCSCKVKENKFPYSILWGGGQLPPNIYQRI